MVVNFNQPIANEEKHNATHQQHDTLDDGPRVRAATEKEPFAGVAIVEVPVMPARSVTPVLPELRVVKLSAKPLVSMNSDRHSCGISSDKCSDIIEKILTLGCFFYPLFFMGRFC